MANKKIVSLSLLIGLLCLIQIRKSDAQDQTESIQVFYDELSPFGQWVLNPDFGYVWFPDVESGFEPYKTNGHWSLTDYGWTWISDFQWGWAAFHYGRWGFDLNLGWFWVPGETWAPAWVIWRRYNDYLAWAPLGPESTLNDAFDPNYSLPNDQWVFMSENYIGLNDIYYYYVPSNENYALLKYSYVINHACSDHKRKEKYNAGPYQSIIERDTRKRIDKVPITDNVKPGVSYDKFHISLYQPKIENQQGNLIPKPNTVVNIKDVPPINQKGNTIPNTQNTRNNNFPNNNTTKLGNNNVQPRGTTVPNVKNGLHPRNAFNPGQKYPIQQNPNNSTQLDQNGNSHEKVDIQRNNPNNYNNGNTINQYRYNQQSYPNNNQQGGNQNTNQRYNIRQPQYQPRQQNQPQINPQPRQNQQYQTQPRQQNQPNQQQYQTRQQQIPQQNQQYQPRQQQQQYQPRQQ